jgi:ribonuclease PH
VLCCTVSQQSQTNEKMELRLSSQTRCDGSSQVRIARSEAVAGVFGPLESRFVDERFEGTIEVLFKNLVSTSSPQEDADVSFLYQEVLESCVKFLPRTVISLSLRVLSDEGAGMTVGDIYVILLKVWDSGSEPWINTRVIFLHLT